MLVRGGKRTKKDTNKKSERKIANLSIFPINPFEISNQILRDPTGFPPDPVPGYSEPEFGCPETPNYHPAEGWVLGSFKGVLDRQKREGI